MPITTGFATRGDIVKGEGHIHSEKWHRCIGHVQGKSGDKYNPYAVCTHSIGYAGSVNKEHRTPGKHASSRRDRFKKRSYEEVLKFNQHHDKVGRFAAGKSTGGTLHFRRKPAKKESGGVLELLEMMMGKKPLGKPRKQKLPPAVKV